MMEQALFEQQTPGPSTSQQYSDEEHDPDILLPYMLFEQGSHDLFCPTCEHAVTGEVILQKRKREFEPGPSEGTPHGIQANLHTKNPGQSLSTRVTEDSVADSAEQDELDMRSALHEQPNFELLCPDCESSITHGLVLQKRKWATSTPDGPPLRKPWTEGAHGHSKHKHPHAHKRSGKGVDDSDEEDPPLKRHRRSAKAGDAEPEEKEIRRILQNQKMYDLKCPDCSSSITYQVVLKKKTSASGKPVGLLEKSGRRHRRSTSSIDKDPWKTRYELEFGRSKPRSKPTPVSRGENYGTSIVDGSVAQPKEREDPQSRGENYGTSIVDGSVAQPKEREDPQSRGQNYRTATGKRSPAQPEEREDPQSGGEKYATAIGKRSPAQPEEREDPQSGGEKYATAIGKRSPAQPEERDSQSGGEKYATAIGKRSPALSMEREDPQSGATKYGTAVENKSLTEPLLPVQHEATGDAAMPRTTIIGRFWDLKKRTPSFVGPALTYFIVMIFLYCLLWIINWI